MDIFITVVNSINKNNVAGMKIPDSTKISKLLYIPQISKLHYLPKISNIYDDEINNYLSNNGINWNPQLIIYTYLCNLLKSCATLINRAGINYINLCQSNTHKFLCLAKLLQWNNISCNLLHKLLQNTQSEFTTSLLNIISPDISLIRCILEQLPCSDMLVDILQQKLFINSLRGTWITACITLRYNTLCN
jgi:hypothetical protein